MNSGYYRFPTIHDDTIIFVSEDDLWCVNTTMEPSSAEPSSAEPSSADNSSAQNQSATAAGVLRGVTRRLTTNHGEVTYPRLSPTGEWVAFVGREEGGPEIYVMDAQGGHERRLTYLNSQCQVVGWMPDGRRIIFSSTYGQVSGQEMGLYTVDIDQENGMVEALPYGPGRSIAFGPAGEVVLGRNTGDPARWKRYRGGTAGHLWIDANGDGEFQRFLPHLAGNIASPMWLPVNGASRIYFVSDHEGIGNLYSCGPAGEDLQRHTDHENYYVRNPSSDGKSIVYHVGADLYVYDVAGGQERRVEVDYRSPRVQRNRKFVYAGRNLDGYALHPSGLAVAITTRGKAFGFFNHEGAVLQYGKRDGVRYREPEWLWDGKRFVVVTDEPGEETLEVFGPEPYGESVRLDGLDLGRIVSMKASPVAAKVALTNHRYELLIVDLDAGTTTLVDRSRFRNIGGFDWAPDGRWIAYSFGATSQTTEIRLYQLVEESAEEGADEGEAEATAGAEASAHDADPAPDATEPDATEPDTTEPQATESDAAQSEARESDESDVAAPDSNGPEIETPDPSVPDASRIFTVTQPVLHDVSPAFDPAGKYLYFLSYREFNPVYDALHFDLSFPWGMRPYLVTLRADLPNPFVPMPDFGSVGPQDEEDEDEEQEPNDEGGEDGDDREGEDEGYDDGYDEGEDNAGDMDEDMDEDEDGFGEPYEEGPGGEEADEDNAGADYGGRRGWMRRRRRRARGRHRYGATVRSRHDAPAPEAENGEKRANGKSNGRSNGEGEGEKKDANARSGPKPLRIDLEGIEQRVVAFPVPDARYGQIAGIRGKAIFTVFPVTGQLDVHHDWDDEEELGGQLRAYDFKDYRSEHLAEHVSSFRISANGKKLIYSTGTQLRVINAGDKAPGGGPPRKSGWIPLHRVKVSVRPQTEWEQMFREAWRLQRDHFWTEDMSQVDWEAVFVRYFDLIPRVSTRSELSDLLWEMQGELGTSHAYEFGGDYRPRPYYGQGFLGADFVWDVEQKGYRVERLLRGDPWLDEAHSPLLAPGADIRPGDILININGQMLDEEIGPGPMLVNQARQEVLLAFKRPVQKNGEPENSEAVSGESGDTPAAKDAVETDPPVSLPGVQPTADLAAPPPSVETDGEQEESQPNGGAEQGSTAGPETERSGKRRYITLVTRTLMSEVDTRYRQWVNQNRRRVHDATAGRIGYVHIPDMGATGYAEFHRGYLAEVDRDGLIVDVRYNGGGHVSQLILEKLARRRIGYDLSRWGGLIPYPVESVAGPLVGLTNEHAGSDGDIFCHSFKLMKLGPLVGKRTWGGVIGIAPQHALVDGTVTTQPEYSFWFEDVGWNVENYGTDPDIEVDNRPQDYRAGVDAQLDRAIEEALRLLQENPVQRPSLDARPSRALPKLPPRTTAAGGEDGTRE